MSVHFQRSASTEPRTSPPKFGATPTFTLPGSPTRSPGPARALPLVLGAVLVGAVVAGAVLVQYLYGAAFPPPDPLDF